MPKKSSGRTSFLGPSKHVLVSLTLYLEVTEYLLISTVIWLLFYAFHPHPEPSNLLPQIPAKAHPYVHEIFFSAASITAGCYLIHLTNEYGHFATMKQAPPVGTIWIWAVIELNILWAVPSVAFCAIYLKVKGYAFL